MRCPFCFFEDTKVVDSRLQSSGDQIRRRRECLECRTRFTTYESAHLILPRVIKNDGRRESFNEDKLRASFLKALEKRSIDTSKIEDQIDKIKTSLRQGGEKEVRSREIGRLVMASLRILDRVAYVRFASVYRSFEDVKSFLDEVKMLEDDLSELDSAQLELLKR